MFSLKKQDEKPNALQDAIDNLYSELAGHEAFTDEYNDITSQIVKLEEHQKKNSSRWVPSPDAVVSGAVSIIGILCILHYEKMGVVTSKALGFVRSTKN